MRFWFAHSTDVPIRDQLVRQVSLGILSGELAPGEKLPSVRALAMRFQLHRNTVSSAYRQLEEENWVTFRRGSGIYIRSTDRLGHPDLQPGQAGQTLEGLLRNLIEQARQTGLSANELHARLDAALARPAAMVLVEGDRDLAQLVLFEIASAGRTAPEVCHLGPERFAVDLKNELAGRMAVVLPSKVEPARKALGPQAALLALEISPVASSLAAHLPRSREHLVAIASHWPRFLDSARALLIAAGFEDESLIVRDANMADWTAGLVQAANVICDSLTRTRLPAGAKPIVFPLLTAAALEHFRPAPDCATFETGTTAATRGRGVS